MEDQVRLTMDNIDLLASGKFGWSKTTLEAIGEWPPRKYWKRRLAASRLCIPKSVFDSLLHDARARYRPPANPTSNKRRPKKTYSVRRRGTPEVRTVECPNCCNPFRVNGPPHVMRCHTCMTVLKWHPAPIAPVVAKQPSRQPRREKPGRKPVCQPARFNGKENWEAAQRRRKAYMESPEWREVRERKFRQVGRACENCGSVEHLQVHHLTYANLYRENLCDLQVLCDSCHRDAHNLPSRPPMVLDVA